MEHCKRIKRKEKGEEEQDRIFDFTFKLELKFNLILFYSLDRMAT